MKRSAIIILGVLLLVACAFATTSVLGQARNIFSVSLVKPKIAMYSAFEASWKLHVAKFHKTERKIYVYEILSGPYSGYFQFVYGPMAYADMDKESSAKTAHDEDWEKTCATKLEHETATNYYRQLDSLSYNDKVPADKFVVTMTHIKSGKMSDYLGEMRRGTLLAPKMNNPFSTSRYVQLWSGSDPVLVTISRLKEGFKQLEPNYFGPAPNPTFREMYIKDYGQEMWDKRVKLLDENITKSEAWIMKFRKDLSSE